MELGWLVISRADIANVRRIGIITYFRQPWKGMDASSRPFRRKFHHIHVKQPARIRVSSFEAYRRSPMPGRFPIVH